MTLAEESERIVRARAAAPVRRPAPRTGGVVRRLVSRYWTIAALLVGWQLWASLNGYNRIVVPQPGEVVADVVGNPGAYLPDLLATLGMSAAGLLTGMTAGVALAVAVWTSPLVSGMTTPIALIMRSVPVVAMIPVLARVFGYGWQTVLVITTIVSFFPAFVFVAARLRDAPRSTSDVFAVLGASRITVLRRLLLPHAVPGLLVAFRLTAPSAVLAAMLAEYLMGGRGLGVLFAQSVSFYQPERAWGTALVATVVSVACFVGARAVERRGLARMT
ncbi:ABC transporter permease [Pseudonocardia sp. WMMC193]|uniref:ABC transporter permease n=1 Tax=Pseudonocardia sp. WMMC193 TaxID=2911965 RepID=UPI001F01E32A|nr:ABC transporter permease subunit [Pseudonocardia sp. WMMC193]MCF7547749.1 ABC transporter permease subunit [Pseudonocardia sp. WMMC193]